LVPIQILKYPFKLIISNYLLTILLQTTLIINGNTNKKIKTISNKKIIIIKIILIKIIIIKIIIIKIIIIKMN